MRSKTSLGYALEFYDEDQWEAKRLIERVREWISTSQCDGLRIVVLLCRGGEKPSLTFLPKLWDERLKMEFETELKRIESFFCTTPRGLNAHTVKTGERHTNRVSRGDFLMTSSSEARLLIESIERQFHDRVNLIFGGSSMTINLRPKGRLIRINKGSNTVSETHPAVLQELALSLSTTPRSNYRIADTHAFRAAIVAGIGKALSVCGTPLVKAENVNSVPSLAKRE